MTIFDYVAISDPWGAKSLLNSYGYPLPPNVDEGDNLAFALNDLAANEGDEALEAIIDMHPDRKLIIEKFSAKEIVAKEGHKGCGCGCGGKQKSAAAITKVIEQSQAQTQTSGWQLHQGNLFLIAATLILAVAIITTHKQS